MAKTTKETKAAEKANESRTGYIHIDIKMGEDGLTGYSVDIHDLAAYEVYYALHSVARQVMNATDGDPNVVEGTLGRQAK